MDFEKELNLEVYLLNTIDKIQLEEQINLISNKEITDTINKVINSNMNILLESGYLDDNTIEFLFNSLLEETIIKINLWYIDYFKWN